MAKHSKLKQLTQFITRYILLEIFGKSFKLKPLQIDYKTSEPIEIKDELWAFVKKQFGITKDKPINMTEFKPLYISMIKNICDTEIIDSKQVRDGKIRIRTYNLNSDYIKESLQLNQYLNPNANDFHLEFVERFQIVPNEELLKQKSLKVNLKLLDFDE